MKKRTLSLLIALVLCLALPGCGKSEEQRETQTVYDQSSSESGFESSFEDVTESSSESNYEEDPESSSEEESESSSERKSESSSGRKTGTKTGNKTDSNTSSNAGSNSGSNTESNSGSNTASNTESNSGSNTDSNTESNSGSNSGSDSGSSGGGSVTPPTQENKIIKSVAVINDITLDYGTKEADAMAKLPSTVVLSCEDGSTVQAGVASWVLDGTYNAQPRSQTTCIATGTVQIPNGYTYAGTLAVTANITVRGGDRTIQGLYAAVTGIEVAYNTAEADAMAKLPVEVTLKTYAGGTISADVTWNVKNGETYNAIPDSTTAVNYAGTVAIPDGYAYVGTLTAETTITVWSGDKTIKELKGPVGGFEVNYGTSEADAIKRLPGEVKLISCTNVPMYTTVTWNLKSGETYKQTPANAATVTYIGTVQIPDGYYFDGTTTMETTITVLESGKSATSKKVTLNYVSPTVYIESYIAGADKNEKNLPDEVRLDCEDGSPITAKLNQTKWNQYGNSATSEEYTIYFFQYSYSEITLPVGYEFSSTSSNFIVGYVYVKFRDDSGLQEAAAAAEALLDRITASESAALTYPDRIYKAPDGTKPPEVSNGVKFIEKGRIEDQVAKLKSLSAEADSYQHNSDKSQVEADALTEKIKKAVEELEKFLDSNSQVGTGFTTENILFNVSKELKSFEGNSNYAYDPANQPLKPQQSVENCLTFPSKVRVVINAAGDEGDVRLTWSIGEDVYAEIREKAEGTQYVWIPNALTEPKNVSFTVTATEYYDGSKWVPLDKQVEAYNNCIVGAPISKYEQNVDNNAIPKLTSGKDYAEFDIVVPFQYKKRLIEIENELDRITVEDTAGNLLGNFKVIAAHAYNYCWPGFSLTAKVAQLPAVVDPADANQCVKGKVKISVPANIITLTDDARKDGWYVPDDKWEAEADVWVYNPVVTVNSAQLSTDKSKVTIAFGASHWGESCNIQAALVPKTEDTFNGTATGSFISPDSVTVNADGDYTVDISVSGITAGEYAVWVKVGDGEWQKSKNVAYTQSGTVSPGNSGE